MSDPAGIALEVQALGGLDLESLRGEWVRRYGDPSPKVRSPELLRYCLAWRIQAAAFGGLDAQARRRLRGASGASPRSDALSTGLRLSREWRGRIYEVDRVEEGYRWRGAIYASLSAVAYAITGVKRNGPKFFGLREEAL